MSTRWPGKYVIGLTGNIATGKSVVRRMLEHLGVFSVDADALSHRTIARGGPAYAEVVRLFGEWILTPQGEVNRARLGRIVFSDPEALARLEAIIHPWVKQATDVLIRGAQAKVAVVEAIKLLESGTAADCDALWVVHVPEAVQQARLVERRRLSPAEARQRIAVQPPQSEKLRRATLIIDNSGSFEDTWNQVQAGFSQIKSASAAAAAALAAPPPADARTIQVRRGKPTDAAAIAEFIGQASGGQQSPSRSDVMAAFGDKAYLLADLGGRLAALAGFKVENLVVRVDEVYLLPGAAPEVLAAPLFEAVESASRELQCEAALLFLAPALAPAVGQALAGRGYLPLAPEQLGVDAWRQAARESMPPGTSMLWKKLREDRVLRPV